MSRFRGYTLPWSRTFSEWNWDENGWFPTTESLEPWPSYLRRIAKRLAAQEEQ